MLDWLLVLLVLHLLLQLLSLQLLIGAQVGVEDLPLGGLEREVGTLGRIGLDALLSQGEIEGL